MNRQPHHGNDGGGEVDYKKFSGFALMFVPMECASTSTRLRIGG